jgi:hypothetical protein
LTELEKRKQPEIAKLIASSDRPQGMGRRGFQSTAMRLVIRVSRNLIPDDELVQLVSTRDVADLAGVLSPRATDILSNQASHPDQVRLIFRWVSASFVTRVSDEELRKFLVEVLDDQQREIIYRLGPEEGRFELIRLYRESRQRRFPPRTPDGDRVPFSDQQPRSWSEPDRGPPRDERRPPPSRDD